MLEKKKAGSSASKNKYFYADILASSGDPISPVRKLSKLTLARGAYAAPNKDTKIPVLKAPPPPNIHPPFFL